MCPRPNGQTYYAKSYLDGTCPKCSGFALLSQCIHKSDECEFGRMVGGMQSFRYVTCELNGGK